MSQELATRLPEVNAVYRQIMTALLDNDCGARIYISALVFALIRVADAADENRATAAYLMEVATLMAEGKAMEFRA
ncbi:MAG: hypothetical protein Q4G71_03860 [Pseudomonadota bacterium]|nr:hypothetical protein [Pseudomonadota bacterium]